MRNFQDIFPGLSRSWNFQEKNPGQCSRWHCSNRIASSRSSVMVERIDVSVRYVQLNEDALTLGHRYDQRSDDKHSAVGRRLETFIFQVIAMLTKEPEMLQTMRFASTQCSKMQLQPWLSAPNPAGVRGCIALPQIL